MPGRAGLQVVRHIHAVAHPSDVRAPRVTSAPTTLADPTLQLSPTVAPAPTTAPASTTVFALTFAVRWTTPPPKAHTLRAHSGEQRLAEEEAGRCGFAAAKKERKDKRA